MNSNLAYEDMFEFEDEVFDMEAFNIVEAKLKFSELKNNRVIIQGDFNDNKWNLSDQVHYVGLDFYSITENYEQKYSDLINMLPNEFLNLIKTFCVFCIGKLRNSTIQNFLSDARKIISIEPEVYITDYEKIPLINPYMLQTFFASFSIKNNNEKLSKITKILEDLKDEDDIRRQRELSEYDSYFLFFDVLNDYWKHEINNVNKIYFFPVWLWWNLSSIIPIRPTEFVLIPRNCLQKKNGEYFLTIRRTKLKGQNEEIHNKLDLDYKKDYIPISDDMAREVEDYIQRTKEYNKGEIDTLFSQEAHYSKYNNMLVSDRSRYYTYFYLKKALHKFFEEVIQNKYGLRIVEKNEKYLDKGCINRIHLGDTRHLALQNCIFNFNNIEIAAALAGHGRINITAHYYTNIPKMINCATYRKYRYVFDKKIIYKIPPNIDKISLVDKSIPCKDGRCLSKKYKNKSFEDCFNASGDAYLIGDCRGCEFFVPEEVLQYRDVNEEIKNNLELELKNFFVLFSHACQSNEEREELKKTILKCNTLMQKYKSSLEMMFEMEDNNA